MNTISGGGPIGPFDPVRLLRRLARVVLSYLFLGLATVGFVIAVLLDPHAGRSAASQDWPAFVLVGGLILVGVVCSETGLFELAGARLAGISGGRSRSSARSSARSHSHISQFVCASILIAVVSAVLNLDTAALFLTPVLVHMARSTDSRRVAGRDSGRGSDDWRISDGGNGSQAAAEAPMLYAALLLCNAGSLLLPGSNLTNIIVSGHLHQSGATFASVMWPLWAVSVAITACVVGIFHRRDLRQRSLASQLVIDVTTSPLPSEPRSRSKPRSRSDGSLWFGVVVVAIACVAVVTLRNAAPVVISLGVVAVAVEVARDRLAIRTALRALDVPVLLGLFEVAVVLGVIGRASALPTRGFAHLDNFGTAFAAAVTSVVFNNLPAASFLGARVPAHPYALLIGLDVGPNLFVTGSLSWFLWLRAARGAGSKPSISHATKLGLISAPLAILAAAAVLTWR